MMVNKTEIIKGDVHEISSLEESSLLEMTIEEDFKYDFSLMCRLFDQHNSKENLEIYNILDLSKVKEENPNERTANNIKEVKIILERINVKDLSANGVKKCETNFSEKVRTSSFEYFSNSQEGSEKETKESEKAVKGGKLLGGKRSKPSMECPECLKVLKSRDGLKRHMLIHSGKKLTCPVCNKNIADKYYLKKHMRMHSSEELFKCDKCEKCFWLKSRLKSHMIIHFEEKKIKCEFCPRLFLRFHNMKSHMKTHANAKEHKCPHCEKCYNLKTALTTHIKTKHIQIGLHGCNICLRAFFGKKRFEEHMRRHSGERPFACPVCGKCYASEYYAKIHQTTHQQRFICNECNEKFLNKPALRRHILIHFPKKPVVCKMCEYKCINPSKMVIHYRTHTGEKPFVCDYCGKRFVIKSNLKRHILVHTGKYPFTCRECKKGFEGPSQLKAHQQLHPVSENTCRICNFFFEHKHAKKMHYENHRSDRSKKCPICGLGFKDDTLMQNHLIVHYKMETLLMCTICRQNFEFQENLFQHCQKILDLLGECPKD